jgi:hypothetical protein
VVREGGGARSRSAYAVLLMPVLHALQALERMRSAPRCMAKLEGIVRHKVAGGGRGGVCWRAGMARGHGGQGGHGGRPRGVEASARLGSTSTGKAALEASARLGPSGALYAPSTGQKYLLVRYTRLGPSGAL